MGKKTQETVRKPFSEEAAAAAFRADYPQAHLYKGVKLPAAPANRRVYEQSRDIQLSARAK